MDAMLSSSLAISDQGSLEILSNFDTSAQGSATFTARNIDTYPLPPDPECQSNAGHNSCTTHALRAGSHGHVKSLAMTTAETFGVDWSHMYWQDKTQFLKTEDKAMDVRSMTSFPSQRALVSDKRLSSKRSDEHSGIMVDDKVKLSIITASDEELAELVQSFSGIRDPPEWYMKLPQDQRDMFDKKAEKKGGRRGGHKDGKNASSTLTINVMLKMTTVAVLCMGMLWP